MSPPAVETRGLVRRFGDFTAVDGLDLSVPKGSFYGFLGPNGAGKSTTIRCLVGLMRPDAGRVSIDGLDPWTEPVETKRRIGVVPEGLALFDRLTAIETLEFVGRVHDLPEAEIARRAGDLLSLLDLDDAGEALAGDLSHGMKKKLALAIALLPAPRILFLDEPFEGIDAVSSREIKALLTSYVSSGGTIFLTSHILEIVERLCDHLGVIVKGRLVAQGPLGELRAGGQSLEETFLELVGAEASVEHHLEWLSA